MVAWEATALKKSEIVNNSF